MFDVFVYITQVKRLSEAVTSHVCMSFIATALFRGSCGGKTIDWVNPTQFPTNNRYQRAREKSLQRDMQSTANRRRSAFLNVIYVSKIFLRLRDKSKIPKK